MSRILKERARRRALALKTEVSADTAGVLRVVFYYRVSTDEQEEKGTVEAQRIYLHDKFRADFRDDAPTAVRMQLVGEYCDDGWSGAKALGDRPDGRRLLDDARAGMFDVVIIYKLDRLGRSARVLIDAHDELERCNVAITSATEPFDTRPGPQQAIGRFVFQLLASLAELERATIRERTMNGKHRVASAGEFINGLVPFGFDVVDNHLVPSRRAVEMLAITESELVQQIFERVAAGETCYAVADWLADAGVPSTQRWFNKQHQRSTDKTNGRWNNQRVWATIKNVVYKGERNLSFDQRDLDQSVPGIVSESVWQTANDRLKRNNKWNGTHDDHVYTLSKKIICSGTLPDGTPCDLRYTGGITNSSADGRKKYRYYRCNGRNADFARRRGAPCNGPMVNVEVENVIWQDLVWAVKHPDEVLAGLQRTLRGRQSNGALYQRQHDELRSQRRVLEQTQLHLRDSLRSPSRYRPIREIEEDLVDVGDKIAQLDADISRVEAYLAVDSALESRLSSTASLMRRLGDQIDDITASNDRVAMKRIVQELVVEVRALPREEPVAAGPGKPDLPRLQVTYAFSTDSTMSSVRDLTNIKTLVIGMLEMPSARERILA